MRAGASLFALAALLLCGATAPAQAPDDTPLTLAAAVERALTQNEDVVVSRLSLDSADAAWEGARGAYDPALSVEGFWRQTSEPANSSFSGAPAGELAPTVESVQATASLSQLLGTGGELSLRLGSARSETNSTFALLTPAYDAAVGVELRQPLLRGRAVDSARSTLRVAAADRERATAELEREIADTVAATERAYWLLVATREGVGVLEDTVGWAEEQLRETGVRIEAGSSPDTEIAQPRAELERRRGDLSAAREAVLRAENSLKLLVLGDLDGELWSRKLVPVDDPVVEPIEVDPTQAMDLALAARPELAAAAAYEARRREELRFARDAVRPSLDAFLSYDRFGLAGSVNPGAVPPFGLPAAVPEELEGHAADAFEVLVDEDFDDTRIGLVLNLPIRNRSALATARIAGNEEQQSAVETARVRKAVRAEVLDAVVAVEASYQRIEAARAEQEAARVQLDSERERFGVGLSTNFLVLTRQNDLARARIQEITARTYYRIARTELARSTGTLLVERGIMVSADDPAER